MSGECTQAVSVNAELYPEPLSPGHIRLLYIDPASGRNFLETHELNEAPPYVCVSYTWGAPEGDIGANEQSTTADTGTVLVNDNYYHVSRSIADIVARVNDYGNVERLWIDSLCINQADSIERSAQVSMMGEIYNSAEVVAVWLGWDARDEFDDVERICQAMQTQYLRLLEEAGGSSSQIEKIPNLFEPAVRDRMGLSFVTREGWMAFARFWNRRWFHRAWVIQEVTLARNPPRIFWGHEELGYKMLNDVSSFILSAQIGLNAPEIPVGQSITRPREWFFLRRKLGETLAKVLALQFMIDFPLEEHLLNDSFWLKLDTLAGPEIRNGRQRKDYMRVWTHLLEIYRAFDATDARDHVYATLGIISAIAMNRGLDPPGIIVDYTRTTSEVYADAAKHIMEAGDCVNLLCLAQDPQTRNQRGLPSWVPDFSAGTEMPILMTAATRSKVMATVCRLGQTALQQVSTHFRVSDDLRSLGVRALLLDEIIAVGECHDELTNKGLWEKTAQILLSRQSFAPDSLNESRIESLWRTMIANTAFDREHIASIDMAESFRGFIATSLITKILHDPDHLKKMPSWNKFMDAEKRLAETRGVLNPAIFPSDEVLEKAAEADRLWTAIEAGNPLPQTSPLASHAARFANATEPMFYRRIILTKQGHLGMGPQSSRPGDTIWLMPGAPLPTVLREKEEMRPDAKNAKVRQLTLLGETYLHGNPDFKCKPEDWKWIELA